MMGAGIDPGDDELLVVERVGKRSTDIHETRYLPTVSLVARFRSRSEGLFVSAKGGGGGGDDGGDDDGGDDDDDDNEREEDEDEPERSARPSGWPLRDVSLRLAAGEAIGVVGDRESVELLLQVVAGATTPTLGLVAYRGRVGLSSEIARALTNTENGTAVTLLRLLARFASVPRRDRRGWIDDAVSLVGGGVAPGSWPWREKETRIRMTIAASLDAAADVLVVDRFPGTESDGFRERCMQRLRTRLADGAAVLMGCADLDAIRDLCTEVIWLDDGVVAYRGPVRETLDRFQSAVDAAERMAYVNVPSFSGTIALHRVDAPERVSGTEGFTVTAELETADHGLSVSARVRLFGSTTVSLRQEQAETLAVRGLYSVALRVPGGLLASGVYRVAVEVVAFKKSGERSSVVRFAQAPVAVDGAYDDLDLPLDTDAIRAEWSVVGNLDVSP
jgi:ABC-type polysaccharide/polyol phosphate transport system ATPase subunit